MAQADLVAGSWTAATVGRLRSDVQGYVSPPGSISAGPSTPTRNGRRGSRGAPLSDDCGDRIVEHAETATSDEIEVFIPHLAGASSRVPENIATFAQRKTPFSLNIHTRWRRMKTRCEWCGSDPLDVSYHDDEWGVPVHDDRLLFEMLILEGAQAGLSWRTILRKRDNYRNVLHGFDFERIATYTSMDVERLLGDPGIVRNRLKIESTITNARAALAMAEEFGSLDPFLWRYVDGVPVQNKWNALSEIAPRTAQSDAMSKDLKRRGFSFVGSTTCYAFMQAVGMVNDHTRDCFRHEEVKELAKEDMRRRGL